MSVTRKSSQTSFLTDLLNLLFQSGLTNITFWVVLAAFCLFLAAWYFRRNRTNALDSSLNLVGGFFSSSPVLALLTLGTLLNVAAEVYKGFVVPRDVLQDFVSAQEFLQGRSLYPDNMNELMRAAIEREPPPISLGRWWPNLYEKEQNEREHALSSHWVQAHPPTMTLLMAPLVYGLGLFGSFAVVATLSLAATAITIILLNHGLGLFPSSRLHLAVGMLVLGWAPVLVVLRAGQMSVVLGALMVGSWYCLRVGRPVLAGIAVAMATALKLYPGFLILYLMLRHRRAFVSACLTLLVIFSLEVIICGLDSSRAWYATGTGVVEEYCRYAANISLLGWIARAVVDGPTSFPLARALWIGVCCAIVAVISWNIIRRREPSERRLGFIDLDCALFVSLMPILSPISWDHYEVLLLLPLAVLGQRAWRFEATPATVAGFWLVLLLVALPPRTIEWVFVENREKLGLFWGDLLVLSIPTYTMLALSTWIAALARRKRAVEN